ncbi:MAG: serine/threonine-protein kinase [Vulcanimicrobiota bacterium]
MRRLWSVFLCLWLISHPALSESFWFDCIPPNPAVAVWSQQRWVPLATSGRCVEWGVDASQPSLRFRLSHPGYEDAVVEVPRQQLQGDSPIRVPLARHRRLTLKPRLARVQFETSPEQAEVYLLLPGGGREYLGLSGQVVALNLATVMGGSQSGLFHIELRKAGYQPVLLPIPSYAFYSQEVIYWPSQGRYALPGRLPPWLGWWLLGLPGLAWLAYRRRGSASSNQLPERKGLRLGDYRLLERVAEGGSATVYRACRWDDPSMQLLAIKVLHPQVMGCPSEGSMILREVELLSRMDHPGIVKVLDWGENLGRAYLVMEWVEGQDLRHTLAASPVSAEACADLLKQLLTALHHAHARGILHRDLKPENLLITQQARLKVTDFGLAITTQQNVLSISGTPGYLAPELLAGKQPWSGSDLYAAGVIACELLTGQLRPKGAPLPNNWAEWIDRLTQPDPSLRFQSAPEALEALYSSGILLRPDKATMKPERNRTP